MTTSKPSTTELAAQGQLFVELIAAEDDAVDARVLDAAAELIGEYGEHVVTMTDIGEHSGVGRATIFRRFGSKQTVIDRMLQRELRKFVVDLINASAECETRSDVLTELLVQAVSFARTNPVVRRLVASEPERLVQFARSEESASMLIARALILGLVKRFEAASTAPHEMEHVADVVAHLAIGYALVPNSSLDLSDEDHLRRTIGTILSGL
ncbi:TetR/AcrR family transcriptional regulator [Mycobacterium sp. PDNC021]|uniref:TetR/AcrR family transcriptional regulator n=1 Tax=Mycobacterium sp. PDNC021 TaxID=3391399 RepID=UPI003AAE4C00